MAPLVLHVVHALAVGGLEAMAIGLCGATDRSRYRSAIVCLREPGALAARAVASGIPVHVLGSPPGVRPGLALALARLARRLRAAVLHTHNTGAVLYAAPGAALLGLPLVHTEHGREPRADGGSARARALAAAERAALARASHVVAVAPVVADALRALLPGRQVDVVPNGVAATSCVPQARLEARRRLGLPAGAPVVGMVGRLEPIKGPDVLLEAAAPLLGRRPEARVVFVGDGSLRGALADRARALGLAPRVTLAGAREDARLLLPAFDVVVLPSRSEGVALVLLEAMAAARPVVATAVGGTPYAAGDAALLVPPGSIEALAAAIERVLGDPRLAGALAERGRRRAAAEFSDTAMAARYMDLYDRARSGSRRRAPRPVTAAQAGGRP